MLQLLFVIILFKSYELHFKMLIRNIVTIYYNIQSNTTPTFVVFVCLTDNIAKSQ